MRMPSACCGGKASGAIPESSLRMRRAESHVVTLPALIDCAGPRQRQVAVAMEVEDGAQGKAEQEEQDHPRQRQVDGGHGGEAAGISTDRTPHTPRMSPPTPSAKSLRLRVKSASAAEMAISRTSTTASTSR